eukprot:5217283-Amphidinium_carterae.1
MAESRSKALKTVVEVAQSQSAVCTTRLCSHVLVVVPHGDNKVVTNEVEMKIRTSNEPLPALPTLDDYNTWTAKKKQGGTEVL